MNDNKTREDWKFERMRKNITLKEVANHVGYSVSMINKYENGHREMSDDKVKLYKQFIENK